MSDDAHDVQLSRIARDGDVASLPTLQAPGHGVQRILLLDRRSESDHTTTPCRILPQNDSTSGSYRSFPLVCTVIRVGIS